jgi:serine/threonine protein phosphatase PrpC
VASKKRLAAQDVLAGCSALEKAKAVTSSIGVQLAARTDVGMRRTTNQDSHALLAAETPADLQQRGHLLMVADGMGAHAAGELASKLATEGVPHLYLKYRELSPPEAMLRAFRETNTEINRRGMANTDFHNMGTTCSMLVLLPQGAIAGHVGDSRIYRFRGDTISQLTFDHSLQWELRASGQLPEGSDIAAVVPKNVITRSLGPNPTVQVDLEGPHPISLDDVYLLCSDGLTGRVEDEEIGAVLGSLAPAEAAQALVDLANLRGGPDNITVLIGRVSGPELVSGASTHEPLRLGGSQRFQPVNTTIWIIAIVCALAAGIIAGMGQMLAAGVAIACAAGAALVALIHRYMVIRGTAVGGTKMLGRGPYSSAACRPNHQLVEKFAATVAELREAAREGDWAINWQPLDQACTAATAANEQGHFDEAVRQYCRAISYVMNELRQQNVKKTGDSPVKS